jgi:hypothetical protein
LDPVEVLGQHLSTRAFAAANALQNEPLVLVAN